MCLLQMFQVLLSWPAIRGGCLRLPHRNAFRTAVRLSFHMRGRHRQRNVWLSTDLNCVPISMSFRQWLPLWQTVRKVYSRSFRRHFHPYSWPLWRHWGGFLQCRAGVWYRSMKILGLSRDRWCNILYLLNRGRSGSDMHSSGMGRSPDPCKIPRPDQIVWQCSSE